MSDSLSFNQQLDYHLVILRVVALESVVNVDLLQADIQDEGGYYIQLSYFGFSSPVSTILEFPKGCTRLREIRDAISANTTGSFSQAMRRYLAWVTPERIYKNRRRIERLVAACQSYEGLDAEAQLAHTRELWSKRLKLTQLRQARLLAIKLRTHTLGEHCGYYDFLQAVEAQRALA